MLNLNFYWILLVVCFFNYECFFKNIKIFIVYYVLLMVLKGFEFIMNFCIFFFCRGIGKCLEFFVFLIFWEVCIKRLLFFLKLEILEKWLFLKLKFIWKFVLFLVFFFKFKMIFRIMLEFLLVGELLWYLFCVKGNLLFEIILFKIFKVW